MLGGDLVGRAIGDEAVKRRLRGLQRDQIALAADQRQVRPRPPPIRQRRRAPPAVRRCRCRSSTDSAYSAGTAPRSLFVPTVHKDFCTGCAMASTSGATSHSTRSAREISASARRTPSASARLSVDRRPAISTRITSRPPRSSATSRTSRVVPGSSDTMARAALLSAVSSDDLPTLGGPASATRRPSRTMRPRPTDSTAALTLMESDSIAAITDAGSSADTSPSSEKSSRASISARASSSVSRQPAIWPDSPPARRAAACCRCVSVSASMRSPRPSTSVRSSRPLRNARRVNSPASASRRPGRAAIDRISVLTTAGEPCTCSSAVSSPVNECGAGIQATRPLSMSWPSMRSAASVRRRGSGNDMESRSRTALVCGPEIRTIATPEGRAPELRATMVSRSLTECHPRESEDPCIVQRQRRGGMPGFASHGTDTFWGRAASVIEQRT